MTEKAIPIHEVFLPRAQGLFHLLRQYVPSFTGAKSRESLRVDQFNGADGSITLRYSMRRGGLFWGHPCTPMLEFRNITPDSPESVVFGPETTLKSERIGATTETVDNRAGDGDVEVDFSDLFSKEDSKEDSKDKSAGGSVKVSIEAEQSVEGVASFKEAVETEAHAEVSESTSTSSSTGKEDTGDEGTIVKPGHCKVIAETRSRADTRQTVTADGAFSFALAVGQYTHAVKRQHQWMWTVWESWQQFLDCVNQQAPDNYPMADSFQRRPIEHADRWALKALDVPLRYDVKFEGKVIRSFAVRDCAGDSQ